MLVGDWLHLAAERVPRRTAVVCGEARYDYATLEAAANRFAHAVRALGLAKGERVAIMSLNRGEYPIVHFGAAKSGCILVNLSVRYSVDELSYVLTKSGVRLLVAAPEALDAVAGALPGVPELGHLVLIGGGDPRLPDALDFDAFIAGYPEAPPAIDMVESDPCAMSYTGGTTGFPKGVLISHKASASTVLAAMAEFGLDERDVVGAVTPMFHTAGLRVWYHPAAALGTTCVLLTGWDPAAFIDLAEREQVTAVFMVPTQLNDLIKHPAFDAARLASLRKIGFAGSPMPVALMERLLEIFPEVAFTGHLGQSETGPITVCPPWEIARRIDTIGRPVLGVEVRVMDADGNTLPPGEIGEIVTRGEHLLIEYFDEPEQTAALYKTGEGWLWTGDMGFVDDAGYFTLVDRSKDMIIAGGENIYPAEIENALYAHPAVDECSVFGIPHERLGEAPAAVVVLKPGAKATADELAEFCAGRIARFKRPRHVEFVDALPKTAVGKVQRNLLREPFWEGRARKI
jgi:acyl-CoA synthetase (AMP-forming)/AMP-acid ligase II